MTPSKLMLLKEELDKVIVEEEDFICIIKLMNDSVFGEEIIGCNTRDTGEDLII